ncbi:MAG: LicD family protein [Lachnospiraceae bacterium]|nr:LicD family protein [Butyrivibrio sp.]MCM1342437.1 LicD family protein [Muribaculaceae bacterium]MCM1410257.1 LicD family protein [Lachnospiraceae bacterium]
MLDFPKEFFLGETRSDFYVEPMMKCAWAAQLEVLAVIERICNKYGIRYFADWGTLLGAVRHKGFIPWDDDTDICMLREDFDRFIAVAEKELPEDHHLFSIDTNRNWTQFFARIINASSIDFSSQRLQRSHGCPYVVGVDIFPLDTVPEDPQLEETFTAYFAAIYQTGANFRRISSEIDELLPDLEECYHIKIDRNGDIQNQLLRYAQLVAKSYQDSGSPVLAELSSHVSDNRLFRKEWYRDCVFLPFEYFELPAPIDYDAVLTTQFDDYMTPVRYSASHDYPFYKKQQELFKQSLIESLTDDSLSDI